MEYLQYLIFGKYINVDVESFKPYYKWNTFNTLNKKGLVENRIKF